MDVQSTIGRRGKCRYHFQTQRSDYGIVKREVSMIGPSCEMKFVHPGRTGRTSDMITILYWH